MNLLDFEYDFNSHISFEGDNETDVNKVDIERITFDTYTQEIKVSEQYYLTTESLREIAIGLEAMAKKIRDYMGDNF